MKKLYSEQEDDEQFDSTKMYFYQGMFMYTFSVYSFSDNYNKRVTDN